MGLKKAGKIWMMALLPLALCAAETVYLNDAFSNNNRTVQDLPSSARWFGSWRNLEVVEKTPGSGDYALKNNHITGTAVRHAVAYFASADNPVTLAAGDRIVFSADVTPLTKNPDATMNVFRMALMDSGTARLTTDANTGLTLKGGYAIINRPAGRITHRLYYRPDNVEQALMGSLNGWTYIGEDIVRREGFPMLQNTKYGVKMEAERLADGNVQITYSVSDGENSFSSSWTDRTHRNHRFDTAAFGWGGYFGDGLIDNVKVFVISGN